MERRKDEANVEAAIWSLGKWAEPCKCPHRHHQRNYRSVSETSSRPCHLYDDHVPPHQTLQRARRDGTVRHDGFVFRPSVKDEKIHVYNIFFLFSFLLSSFFLSLTPLFLPLEKEPGRIPPPLYISQYVKHPQKKEPLFRTNQNRSICVSHHHNLTQTRGIFSNVSYMRRVPHFYAHSVIANSSHHFF